jgi:hypothetical protein
MASSAIPHGENSDAVELLLAVPKAIDGASAEGPATLSPPLGVRPSYTDTQVSLVTIVIRLTY